MIKDIIAWYHQDKSQIWWTIGGAVLSTIMGLLVQNDSFIMNLFKSDYSGKFNFALPDETNYGVQSLFIFIAIFVLLKSRRGTLKDLKNFDQITSYMNENCNLRVFKDRDNLVRYNIVRRTTLKFYYLWLAVWGFWLCYYLGNFLLTVLFPENNISLVKLVYSQTFDFLNSLVLLGIYLILTEVTEERKYNEDRETDGDSLWGGLLFIIILAIFFFVGLVYESSLFHNADTEAKAIEAIQPNVVSVLLSVFSAMCFVLVLGKINSNYMRIPNGFLIIMYVYAIMQCYIPLAVLSQPRIFQVLADALPYITLIGKMFILLSLCWMTYQRRLLFFIIHRSTAIDNIPRMLSELNQEIAEY